MSDWAYQPREPEPMAEAEGMAEAEELPVRVTESDATYLIAGQRHQIAALKRELQIALGHFANQFWSAWEYSWNDTSQRCELDCSGIREVCVKILARIDEASAKKKAKR